jgi:hypothetical protein
MTVKAYLIVSDQCRWGTPHLFESEAKEIAELMTVISGRYHWLDEIHLESIANVLGRFNGSHLTLNVWNLRTVEGSFEGETTINDRPYFVQLKFPFQPWEVVAT